MAFATVCLHLPGGRLASEVDLLNLFGSCGCTKEANWPTLWWAGSGDSLLFEVSVSNCHHNVRSGNCQMGQVVLTFTGPRPHCVLLALHIFLVGSRDRQSTRLPRELFAAQCGDAVVFRWLRLCEPIRGPDRLWDGYCQQPIGKNPSLILICNDLALFSNMLRSASHHCDCSPWACPLVRRTCDYPSPM